MHIEPGIVSGAKMVLSYGTATVAFGLLSKAVLDTVNKDGVISTALRGVIASVLVFCFFQVLPHHPVGVSEVHFILGSTLLLMFGLAPAAIGLVVGLGIQGLLFAPTDLPQFAMNITTLLVPLFAMSVIAKKIIPERTRYVDIQYSQALSLSVVFQGGIVTWVAFWAFYGQGFGAENLASVGSFSVAYMSVIVIEPILDLVVLAVAKWTDKLQGSSLLEKRLYSAA